MPSGVNVSKLHLFLGQIDNKYNFWCAADLESLVFAYHEMNKVENHCVSVGKTVVNEGAEYPHSVDQEHHPACVMMRVWKGLVEARPLGNENFPRGGSINTGAGWSHQVFAKEQALQCCWNFKSKIKPWPWASVSYSHLSPPWGHVAVLECHKPHAPCRPQASLSPRRLCVSSLPSPPS